MKMVKSLILGSAAGLVAMSGAQAADLPVKAKPVEYVRICSLYGAGFFYIPGTDTCIKLGGYLRVDSTFNGNSDVQPALSGDAGPHNRYGDYFAARSRLALTVDTRTATEYGVVRTFGRCDFNLTTQGINTTGPLFSSALRCGTTAAGIVGSDTSAFKRRSSSSPASPSVSRSRPQRALAAIRATTVRSSSAAVTTLPASTRSNTAQFGNGVSGTIGTGRYYQTNRLIHRSRV